MARPAPQGAAAAAVQNPPKTAVVVIHGMGEQRPMETLRGLVSALWSCDRDVVKEREKAVYSKPDAITGSFELRRITTRNGELEAGGHKRVDFFEFYWAHLMTGNTVASVAGWAAGLLIRRPSSVPRRLILPWLAGLGLMLVTVVLLALAAAEGPLKDKLDLPLPGGQGHWYLAASIFALLFGVISTAWLAPVAGDAARYLSPTPDNVDARQKIREAGVDLLTQLHQSGRYDRIVVIGHSLGSVIGFDVLNCAWGRIAPGEWSRRHPAGSDALKALAATERAAGELIHAEGAAIGPARIAYRAAQRAYLDALARPPSGFAPVWLVSDFVTLGCPLSKADVLLARDANDLIRLKREREVPSCPPWLEKNDPKQKRFRFSYPVDEPVRTPHHAAVFAPVVFTNVYFGWFAIAFGDIISGAVAPLLGRGVLDVHLKIGAPVFRHLDYWKDPTAHPPHPWLKALRRAVNLKRIDDVAVWGAQATADPVEGDALP